MIQYPHMFFLDLFKKVSIIRELLFQTFEVQNLTKFVEIMKICKLLLV